MTEVRRDAEMRLNGVHLGTLDEFVTRAREAGAIRPVTTSEERDEFAQSARALFDVLSGGPGKRPQNSDGGPDSSPDGTAR